MIKRLYKKDFFSYHDIHIAPLSSICEQTNVVEESGRNVL